MQTEPVDVDAELRRRREVELARARASITSRTTVGPKASVPGSVTGEGDGRISTVAGSVICGGGGLSGSFSLGVDDSGVRSRSHSADNASSAGE